MSTAVQYNLFRVRKQGLSERADLHGRAHAVHHRLYREAPLLVACDHRNIRREIAQQGESLIVVALCEKCYKKKM